MTSNTKKIVLLKEMLGNINWGIRQLIVISPQIMILMTIAALLESVLPAGLALSTRFLINSISEVMSSDVHYFNVILTPLLFTLAFIIVQNVCTAVKGYLALVFRDEVNLKISHTVMEHASKHEVAFFENSENQDLLARVNQNTANHLSNCFINVLNLAADLVKLSSLSVILIFIEPLVAIVIIPLFLPYLYFKIQLAKDRYSIHHGQAFKRRWTHYFIGLLTQPEKVTEIRLLGIAEYFLEKFRTIMAEFNTQEKSLYKRTLVGNLVFSTIANLVIFMLLWKIIVRVLAGALTIGDVVIFIGTSANLRNLLENTTNVLSATHEHSSYIGNYREFLSRAARAGEKRSLLPVTFSGGTVELKDITFTYPGTKKPILKNISLKIQPGETIALVGQNAAGKTTLAKLIAGLYKPDSGVITIDGQDLQDCSPQQLYRKIAYVFQNFGKFEASVADNIAVGDWQKLMDNEAAIKTIAREVNLNHIIKNYPQGYKTLLGRLFGTYDPSGGQWQYIAIARAFAKESVLLILDEPTANLDIQSEYELFKRFKDLAAGRTTVLISHRFSTVKIADRIIVLNEQTIIENGTHKELLQKGGSYAAMFKLYQNQMDFEHLH